MVLGIEVKVEWGNFLLLVFFLVFSFWVFLFDGLVICKYFLGVVEFYFIDEEDKKEFGFFKVICSC